MRIHTTLPLLLLLTSCVGVNRYNEPPVVPAEEFSDAVYQGKLRQYSFHKRARMVKAAEEAEAQGLAAAAAPAPAAEAALTPAAFAGDPRFLREGFQLKASANAPSPQFVSDGGAAQGRSMMNPGQPPYPPPAMPAAPPPGSSAPYYQGQMTANPSLWPDEAQGAFLFTDHRAFQPMDVITILIDENNRGKKKADTETEVKFDLVAGIAEFFGIETKKWAANNTSLDPSELINASTSYTHEAEGETQREGTLRGQISAVIMELLPNGLMRIEGTKILSLNAEEEVLVISGLVRPRDINSNNQVDSGRIANMRIDFYGRGSIGDHQEPGWGMKIFRVIWPF